MPILLSIIACFGWGVADYFGGLKSRQLPVLAVLTLSTLTGIILLIPPTFIIEGLIPFDPHLLWAIPAGPIGVAAMYFLYRALSSGVMAILAPISATGVILPVAWGLLTGESMSGLSFAGILMAFTGSILAVMEKSEVRGQKRMTKGVGLALSSALFVGLYFIFMDLACVSNPVWASLIMRSTTFVTLLPLLWIAKIKLKFSISDIRTISFMGTADVLAAVTFAIAASGGLISQVAVISSLYPAVTVMLSTVLLKERIAKIQMTGVCLAILGVMMISAF